MVELKKFDDFILEKILAEIDESFLLLNESDTSDKLLKHLSKIFDKTKNLKTDLKKRVLSHGLVALLSIFTYSQVVDAISKADKDDSTLAIELLGEIAEEDIFKSPLDMKVSSEMRIKIKEHEGDPKQKGEPVLTAYRLGDGMITVGWGHAEKRNKSKYKKGQKITREEAEELFQKDLQEAADAVRRIFAKWEEDGIEVKLTKEQFDSLVSLTFNAGIGNVRRSDFIQSIKKNDLKKAGEQILTFKTSPKFPGLELRRAEEAKPFLDIIN